MSEVVAPSFLTMAWNGFRLLIVTRDGDTILTDGTGRARNHGAHLPLPDPLPVALPSVSGKGNGFVVTWPEPQSSSATTVFVTTLTSTGAIAKAEMFPYHGESLYVSIGCNPSGSSCLLLRAGSASALTGEILGKTPELRLYEGLSGPGFRRCGTGGGSSSAEPITRTVKRASTPSFASRR